MRATALRLPPPLAVKAAVAALAPVAVLTAVAYAVAGPVGVVWFVLGVTTGLPVATHVVPWTDRGLVLVLGVAAAVTGLAVDGRPVEAALVVAALSLLQAPLTRRTPGAGAMLPVLAAVAASTGLPDRPWSSGAAVAAGMVTVVVTAGALGLRRPAVAVSASLAWRHGTALAACSALALGVVMHLGVTHGYWLVLALALVLRPEAASTRELARDRMAGTAVGVVAGALAVALLPAPVALAAAVPCVLLTAAWALAGDNRRSAACSAPLVVLLGSSGFAGTGVALALERVLATLVGVAAAVVVSLVVDRLDRA